MTTFAQHETASLVFIDKTPQCTQYTELNWTDFVTFSLNNFSNITMTKQIFQKYFRCFFFSQNYKFLEHFQSDHILVWIVEKIPLFEKINAKNEKQEKWNSYPKATRLCANKLFNWNHSKNSDYLIDV